MLHDRLSSAFDRLDDFVEVQGPKISIDTVELLQEAVGVTDPERRLIKQRVEALKSPEKPAQTGAVLLGIIVGLFAAQLEEE
jgi:hypothetical protein